MTILAAIVCLVLGYVLGDSMSRVHVHIPDVNEPRRGKGVAPKL